MCQDGMLRCFVSRWMNWVGGEVPHMQRYLFRAVQLATADAVWHLDSVREHTAEGVATVTARYFS